MTNPVLMTIYEKVKCFALYLNLSWNGGQHQREHPWSLILW